MIPISAYTPFFSDKQQRHLPGGKPYQYEFYQFMEGIRDGLHKAIIDQLRAIEDKNERASFKAQNLLAVTLSCTCKEWRKEANIVEHSGLMGIDIDPDDVEIDDWAALRDTIADKIPVVAAALSASGRGLFFVIRVPKNISLHRDIYTYVSWKITETFGLRVDPTGKNPDRLRFTSYDPDCYINYDIDFLPVIVPDAEYWKAQAEAAKQHIETLPATSADSINVFRSGMIIAETETHKRPPYKFEDGQKHPYLVVVASHCNVRGMREERCKDLAIRLLGHRTGISTDELCRPISNVYKTYAAEHGKYPLNKPVLVPLKQKKWLLARVDKQYLRSWLFLYGRTYIPGVSGIIIRVSSPLLVMLMHLYAPQHSWTCDDMPGATIMTNEDCASVFRPDCKISLSNDEVIFVEKDYGYPKSWDE